MRCRCKARTDREGKNVEGVKAVEAGRNAEGRSILPASRREAVRTAEEKKKTGGVGRMEYQVGDIVKLKKKHPCGSQEWEILRVGADFRLKCMGCGHQIMVARKLVEKNTKGLRPGEKKI